MRTAVIFVFAFLALTAQAKVNLSDLFLGFTTKIGMNLTQQAEFSYCAASALKLLDPLSPSIENGTIKTPVRKLTEFIMASDEVHSKVINHLNTVLTTEVKPICGKFFRELKQALTQGKAFNKLNLKVHSHVIISNLTLLGDQIAAGKSHEAGETIAYILQVAYGVVSPAPLKMIASTSTEVKVTDEHQFSHKAFNSIAKALGGTEEITLEKVIALEKAWEKFKTTYVDGRTKIRAASNKVEKYIISANQAREFILATKSLVDTIGNSFDVYLKKLPALTRDQVKRMTVRVIHNALLNLPAIDQEFIEMAIEIAAKHPVATGEHIAHIVKLLA